MRLLCHVFGHRRSRRKAKFDYDDQRWTSVCKWCGIRLDRDPIGNWKTVAESIKSDGGKSSLAS